MWGFVFVLKQKTDSSVLYEQFKSNLVDPSDMRHVVALLLAQQVRFPWANRPTTDLIPIQGHHSHVILFSPLILVTPPSPDRPSLAGRPVQLQGSTQACQGFVQDHGIRSTIAP